MRIHHIACPLIKRANGFGSFPLRRKFSAHALFRNFRCVCTVFGKALHLRTCFFLPSHMAEQALQIAGNEDIHRRRNRHMKRPVPVICACTEEIIQHFVVVRRADEMPDRQPHLHRVPAREDIPEIPRRYRKIQFFSQFDFSHLCRPQVRPEIVNNLRHKPPDIDRICRGKTISLRIKFRRQSLIRKYAFYRALCIVKIPFNAHNTGIFALLCRHLQFLHRADAVLREKYHNACTFHAREALQSRLARIAGGCSQYYNFLFQPLFFGCRFHQIRQYGQCHVLKRQCPAVEQLQKQRIALFHYRHDFRRIKFFVIRPHDAGFQLLVRKVQIKPEHLKRQLPVIQLRQFLQCFPHFGNLLRNIQPPIRADTPQYRLRSRRTNLCVPCADVCQCHFYSFFLFVIIM